MKLKTKNLSIRSIAEQYTRISFLKYRQKIITVLIERLKFFIGQVEKIISNF